MATDATGTPTNPDNIPTYNTAADPPSGKGFNAAMAAIQAALLNRLNISTLWTAPGDLAYASAAGVAARLGIGGAGQVLTVAGGVPTWAAAPGAALPVYATVAALNSGIPAPTNNQQAYINPGGDEIQATNMGELMLMTYNSTTSKWVSQPQLIYATGAAQSPTTSDPGYKQAHTANSTYIYGGGSIGYKPWVTAGLTLNCRTRGAFCSSITTASDCYFYLGSGAQNKDGASVGNTAYFGIVYNNGGVANSYYIKDSGWTAAAGTIANADILTVLGMYTCGPTAQTLFGNLTCHARWTT